MILSSKLREINTKDDIVTLYKNLLKDITANSKSLKPYEKIICKLFPQKGDTNQLYEYLSIYLYEREDYDNDVPREERVKRFPDNFFDFIIRIRPIFDISDIFEMDQDFVDCVFDHYYTYYYESIENIKGKFKDDDYYSRLITLLSHYNLLKRFGFPEKNENGIPDINDFIIKMDGDNAKLIGDDFTETERFLISNSPYNKGDGFLERLLIDVTNAYKSQIYTREEIIAKLVTINPEYYKYFLDLYKIDQIFSHTFDDKDYEFYEFASANFTKLDRNIYECLQGCKDFSLREIKKYILSLNEDDIDDEYEIFKHVIRENNMNAKSLRQYIQYANIFNYKKLLLVIYKNPGLELPLLCLKYFVGENWKIIINDQVNENINNIIFDMFRFICAIFNTKFYVENIFEGDHSTYHTQIHSHYKKLKPSRNQFQKIAIALLVCKHFIENIDEYKNKPLFFKYATLVAVFQEFENYERVNFEAFEIDIKETVINILIQKGNINLNLNNMDINIPMNIYEIGVNVHDRDEITYRYASSFYNSIEMTAEEIQLNFREFWEFKDKLNEADMVKFLRVLGVDQDLNPVRNMNDFGGLLAQDIYLTINKENYGILNSTSFLAKLWKFANTYKEDGMTEEQNEKEREMIKEGLLRGIISCVQDDGVDDDGIHRDHVVCNPGKLQRIIVATINGRFSVDGKILDIDGTGTDTLTQEIDDRAEDEYIKNINEIYLNLNDFFASLEQKQVTNTEDLLMNLYIYTCDKAKIGVLMDPIYVTYAIYNIVDSMDGIMIDPENSIISTYSGILNLTDYKNSIMIKKDIHNFIEANPEVKQRIEDRRLKALENEKKEEERERRIEEIRMRQANMR